MIKDLRGILRWRGRAPRRQYWVAMGVAAAGCLLGVAITVGAYGVGFATAGFAIGVLVLLASLLPLGVTTVQRLRDRNHSTPVWLVMIVGPGFAVDLAGRMREQPVLNVALLAAGGAIFIWSVVELGFLRGTVGRNRYGDDPLQAEPADAFS